MSKATAVVAVVIAGAAGLAAFYFLRTAAAKTAKDTSMQVASPPPPTANVGDTVIFQGKLVDKWGVGLEGKAIKLLINGALFTSGIAASDGYWSFSFVTIAEGTLQICATFTGDASYNGSSTPTYTTVVGLG